MSLISPANDFALQSKPVLALAPDALSGNATQWVNLQFYERLLIVLMLRNGAAAVQAATVTLKQATSVDGTDEKALAFSNVYVNTRVGSKDVMVPTAVVNDTFDTDATADAQLLYVIEVTQAMMDWDTGFKNARLDLSGGLNATVAGLNVAWPPIVKTQLPTVIVD